MSILFRPNCGGLAEAMDKVSEVSTITDLIAIIQEWYLPNELEVTPDMIHITPYGYDHRIGWHTYIVVVSGWGVVGFTNGNFG